MRTFFKFLFQTFYSNCLNNLSKNTGTRKAYIPPSLRQPQQSSILNEDENIEKTEKDSRIIILERENMLLS